MRRINVLVVSIAALVTVSSVVATAGQPPAAVLRVESLDAAMADVERLAGAGLAPDEMLSHVLGTLGFSDASVIDGTRPITVVLPQQGLMLGAKGLVGVVPVKQIGTALEAISAAFDRHEVDDELHLYSSDGGRSLAVLPNGGYLLVGLNRDLVAGLDRLAALDPGDLPPGRVALDVRLESFAPMARMGIAMGRQAVKERLATQDGDDTPGHDDSLAMAGLMEPYFDFLQDFLANVSRLQVSIELTADHLVLHDRVFPVHGSTLAGLLEAQSGGLPGITRHLDAGATAAMVGQVRFTPAFTDAIRAYTEKYVAALEAFSESTGMAQQAELSGVLLGSLGSLGSWTECYRGDFAASYHFDAEAGMQVTQIAGARNAEVCRQLIDAAVGMLEALPATGDGRPMITMKENALTHGGVTAMRQETRLPFSELAGADGAELMQWLFGESPMAAYTGLGHELLLSTTGAGAEQRFKALVDRVAAKRSARRVLTAADFEPLQVGPGVFAYFDVKQFLDSMPEESLAQLDDELSARLGSLSEATGRVVYGAHLRNGRLDAAIALPLGLLIGPRTHSDTDRDGARPIHDPGR